MRRYAFAAILGIVGVAVLVNLGLWQLRRMEEKRVYLDQIEARIHDPAIALPDQPNPEDHKFRAVAVQGAFTGQVIEVLAGQKGGSPGVRLIEVFEVPGGRRILIDRGFLPEDARKTPRVAGAATVSGHLHWPDDVNKYTPPPDPKTGLWFGRDVPAMAKALSAEQVLVVASAPTGDAITPVPLTSTGIPNDHWGYAITWFSLAVVWAAMSGYLGWRIRRRTA